MKRIRYSIQIIHANGAPVPFASRRGKYAAIDLAEETARATKLEVRIWDTQEAKCFYTIPAEETSEAAA